MTIRYPKPFEYYWWGLIVMMFIGGALSIATGKTGFAMIPLTNAVFALMVFTFASLYLSAMLARKRAWDVPVEAAPLMLMIIIVMLLGIGVGLANGNSKKYVISTIIYWSNWLMLLSIIPVIAKDYPSERLVRFAKVIAPICVVMSAFGLRSMHAGAPIMISMAAVFLISRRSVWMFLLCISPIVMIGSDLNRATMLGFAVAVFVVSIIARRGFSMILLMGVALAAVGFLAFGDIAAIADPTTPLYRRLAELQFLFNGAASMEDFVALKQRFYEVSLVRERLSENTLNWLFGSGFGATIDMRASEDESLTAAALEGASSVHNIHSLPHSLMLRSGMVGVLLLTVMVICLVRVTYLCWKSGSRDYVSQVCVVYCWASLFNAFPASNYLLTDFIWGGMLSLAATRIRAERRAANREAKQRAVSRLRPPPHAARAVSIF